MYNKYIKEKEIKPVANNTAQPSITAFVATGEANTDRGSEHRNVYARGHPRQTMLADSIVQNMIIGCNLPVSLVDHPKFRKVFFDFDSKFSMPCRQTVTSSMIPKYLKVRKEHLIEHLKEVHYVSLTADAWTDRRAHAFLGVTVHTFLNGEVKSQLLAFRSFGGSHTGPRIADEMEAIIAEFALHGKVRYVVTDNASNMKRAMCILFSDMATKQDDSDSIDGYFDDASLWTDVEYYEAVTGMDVGKRLLQLVVRDGLKSVAFARSGLGKASKLSSLVHQSALFREAFETTFGTNNAIPEANATRWNSVWLQLRTVVNLDQQKLTDLLKSTAHENLTLSPRELQQLQEVVEVLAPFAELTDICQGDKSMTISCVVPGLLSLMEQLNECERSARHSTALIQSLRNGCCSEVLNSFFYLI